MTVALAATRCMRLFIEHSSFASLVIGPITAPTVGDTQYGGSGGTDKSNTRLGGNLAAAGTGACSTLKFRYIVYIRLSSLCARARVALNIYGPAHPSHR